MSNDIGTKVCSQCREDKSMVYFSFDETHKDGHKSQCKECMKQSYAKSVILKMAT